MAVTIDEFMTSRICNLCYEDSLEKMNGVKSQSVLGYRNCKALWQKDVNAAKNMLLISSLMGVVMVIRMCFLLKQDPEFNLYRRTKHGFFPGRFRSLQVRCKYYYSSLNLLYQNMPRLEPNEANLSRFDFVIIGGKQ